MKKKLLICVVLAIATGSILEARRYHRGHHGWGRRGWGWGGPAVGFGLSVPLGGGSSGPKRPASVKQFKKENGYYPSSAGEFCKWAKNYFTPQKANQVCHQYENYLNAPRTSSRPSGYMSFGVGGGYGGYGYGGPWGYRPWW